MKEFKTEKKGNKSSKKRKALTAATGLALVALLSGTFAWLNARDERINRLSSGLGVSDGSVSVQETFKPTPITPGQNAEKKVTISNTGKSPVLVRVSFEEVLKTLSSKGEEETSDTKWTKPDSEKATLSEKESIGRNLPVRVDTNKYKVDNDKLDADDNDNRWVDVTNQFDSSNKVPDGITVMAKGFIKLNPTTNTISEQLQYELYATLEDGTAQKVAGKIEYSDVKGGDKTTAGTTVKDWTFKYDNTTATEYYVYKNGYQVDTVNWALNTLNNADNKATGASLLGTKGQRYGKNYDYRNATDGGYIPDSNLNITPAALISTAGKYPTDTVSDIPIQSEKRSNAEGLIQLGFNSNNFFDPQTIDTNTTPADKWVYNPEDGWFYYTQVLKSGATTSTNLEKISYSQKIGKEYIGSNYDLIVKMEAFQAVKEVLTDKQDGFKLNEKDTTNFPVSNKVVSILSKSIDNTNTNGTTSSSK